jgi:hypothetical protein
MIPLNTHLRIDSVLRFLHFLPVVLLLAAPLSSEVVINEFVASNGSVLMDEDGDFEDWIELHNTGSEPVNLEGWGLSDDSDTPFKWTFPSRTIGPGEHLLVWASGKDRRPGSEDGEDENDFSDPASIEGLTGWFSAGTLSGLSDGDPVDVWPDLSGLGNDAIQTVANARPTFANNAINGLPALHFNGSNQQFSLPNQQFAEMADFENFTLFTLVRWNGGITSGIFGTGPSNTNSGNMHLEVTSSGGTLRLRVGAMNSISAGNVLEEGAWALVGASQSAGDEPVARLFRDGEIVGTRTEDPGTVNTSSFGGIFLGNSHDSPRNFDGHIAEFILYNHSLSPDQRREVERYLADKYNLFFGGPAGPQLHANFRISADGEPLSLTRPDGSTADEVPPVMVPRDTSYGRFPDGIGDWFHFLEPTPSASNTTQTYSAPLSPPEFSHARGFYETPFELTLSHGDPEAEIRFTTDGSPPTQSTGTLYQGPVSIEGNTVVRAVAHTDTALPAHHVMTHSYLFLEEVIAQPDDPEALNFPAQWGSWDLVHYGMTPEVTQNPAYAPRMVEALTGIPSISLVIDMDDMFHPDTGIYPNRTRKGQQWERPVSMELIHPNGNPGFQINAGLRSQGGASRQINNTPKASLRVLFKSDYEARRLEHPFFLSSGSDMADFNTITFRAEYNNEWLHWASEQRNRGLYMRDRFIRDSQIAVSGSGSHSKHVHLYINGVYWGLYNPSERIDAAFGSTYFGGEREDWDALTHNGVRDGNREAWDAMVSLTNAGLSSLESYEAIREYLDVPQYIDYLIVNMWAGMDDWPHNNWNAIRRREPGAGWMFFCWDSERSMEGLHNNRTNVSADAARFYAELRNNAEFRLLFADHVQRHLFNDGALTPEKTINRFIETAAIVEAAVIAESARWGSYRRDKHCRGAPCVLYTHTDHWMPEFDRIVNNYLPQRTGIVINQFRNAGLYPNTEAPVFSPRGGVILGSSEVSMTSSSGTIYYTLNGGAPRIYGTGEIASRATPYTGTITITDDTVIKARVFDNGEWSALDEVHFATARTEPHPIAEGSYEFNGWSREASAGTYPPHMLFEQVQESDPGLRVEMDGLWQLPYNLESRSRVNGLGEQGLSFINTANTQENEEAGYLGSAVLSLDTRDAENIRVQWTAGTVTPNDRVYALRLQYRVGPTGVFSDVPGPDGMPLDYLRNETPGHSRLFGPVTLPLDAEGEPYVELRWKYYHVLGDSGPRAELRLDNILVAAGDPGDASALAFESHPPSTGQSVLKLPPIVVRATTADGFIDPLFDGEITLSLSPDGTGALTGTTTVPAVDGVATFEGLAVEGAGVFRLKADTGNLEAATSDAFRIVRLNELVMPRYIQGEQDATADNNNRVPFAFRLSLEGLRPNSVYRYGNRIITGDDPPEQNGAGNAILVTGREVDWIRNTDSPRFRPGDFGSRHYLFTTDSEGTYSGWFVTEPSGNPRFTPGNDVGVRLLLNDGEDGEEYHHFLTTEEAVRVIGFGTGPEEATGVVGESVTGTKQFVVLYDNVAGEGRPLAATVVEITGAEVDDRYAPFYHEIVAQTPNRWGTLIPNDLATGIRRIEERSLEDGSLVAVGTFSDGIAATISPNSGIQPVFLNDRAAETYQLWVERVFPDPDDRENPVVSGPQADPWGNGITNLVRYALEIAPGDSAAKSMPLIEIVDDRLSLLFHRSPAKTDIAYIVEVSSDLVDWTEVLYDSTTDPQVNTDGEMMRVLDSAPISGSVGPRFLRLRIVGQF